MPRKEVHIPISDPSSRDDGKVFLLTEMPATKAEKWATRAFLALAAGGVEIPEDIRERGILGIAAISFNSITKLRYEDASVLMDEMFTCVSIITDPAKNMTFSRPLEEDDIQEVKTRIKLRAEVITLHTGFSLADVVSAFRQAMTSADSPNTETSQDQLEP